MPSKIRLPALLSLILLVVAGHAASIPARAQAPLETDDQKILYSLGLLLGQSIESAALTEADLASVVLGLTDSALRREARVDLDQYGPMLQAFMEQRTSAAAEVELREARAFLEGQAAMDGALRTDSGIVIQEIVAGTGAHPTALDTVTVHYHGTLRNGAVFDSSIERGEPATFPLNQVIPCWTEGVQTMQVGGTSRLVCPPDLAYGTESPPGIPGNSALVFEVELISIVPSP